MANALYVTGKSALMEGGIDLVADTIKAVPVDATYSPNLTTDAFLSVITAGKRVATPVALTTKSVAAGVFDADDVTFPAVSGSAIAYIVLYKDTGVEGTSQLIAILDTAAGLPYTPVGADLTVRWSNGANKIFSLT